MAAPVAGVPFEGIYFISVIRKEPLNGLIKPTVNVSRTCWEAIISSTVVSTERFWVRLPLGSFAGVCLGCVPAELSDGQMDIGAACFKNSFLHGFMLAPLKKRARGASLAAILQLWRRFAALQYKMSVCVSQLPDDSLCFLAAGRE